MGLAIRPASSAAKTAFSSKISRCVFDISKGSSALPRLVSGKMADSSQNCYESGKDKMPNRVSSKISHCVFDVGMGSSVLPRLISGKMADSSQNCSGGG